MKKKSLTMLLTGLLAVSLTGVGFASWIIVQGDTEEPTGSVAVETVTTKKVDIVPVWQNNDGDGVTGSLSTDYATSNTDLAEVDKQGDNQFSFGAPAASSTGWLRSDTTYKEILTLKLDVYVVANSDVCTGVTASIETSDEFKAAVTATYLTTPTAEVAAKTTKEVSETTYDVYTITISTSWGAFWENQNPYEFYTEGGATADKAIDDATYDTYAEHAAYYIQNLYDTLNGATFTLTLTAKTA